MRFLFLGCDADKPLGHAVNETGAMSAGFMWVGAVNVFEKRREAKSFKKTEGTLIFNVLNDFNHLTVQYRLP